MSVQHHHKGTLTQVSNTGITDILKDFTLQQNKDQSQSDSDTDSGDYKRLRHRIGGDYGSQNNGIADKEPKCGSTYYQVESTKVKLKFVGQLHCNLKFTNDVPKDKSICTATLIHPRLVLTCAHNIMAEPIIFNITTGLIDTNKIQNHGLTFNIDKETETIIVTNISSDSPFKPSKLQIGDIIRNYEANYANGKNFDVQESQQFYSTGCNGDDMKKHFEEMWRSSVNKKQTIEIRMRITREPVQSHRYK